MKLSLSTIDLSGNTNLDGPGWAQLIGTICKCTRTTLQNLILANIMLTDDKINRMADEFDKFKGEELLVLKSLNISSNNCLNLSIESWEKFIQSVIKASGRTL